MATVNLDRLWFNAAADPSDRMSFAYAGDGYQVATSRGGGVEGGYASGRRRGWSTAEVAISVSGLTLHMTTPEQRKWLLDHVGVTVCLRDHLGHKVFGRFQSAPVTVSTLPVGHSAADNQVSLSFESVTFSEAV